MGGLEQREEEDQGTVPPFNVEAEQSILGICMVADQKIVTETIGALSSRDFYRDAHQKIFDAIRYVHGKGGKPDIVLVTSELKRRQQLENVGGRNYVTDLSLCIAATANYEYHIEAIRDAARARRSIDIARKLMRSAEDVAQIERNVQEAYDALALIRLKDSSSAGKSIDILAYEVLGDLYWRQKYPDSLIGVPSGFPSLDHELRGFGEQTLSVVAARPGMGKTIFGLTIAKRSAEQYGTRTAFYSLEMPAKQLTERLYAMESGIYASKLKIGNLTKYDCDLLLKAAATISTLPLDIRDFACVAPTVAQIEADVMQLRAEGKAPNQIVIDHLHKIRQPDGMTEVQAVTLISGDLKRLANKLGIPVIALCQLNRAVESQTKKEPTLKDLRSSGSIEQDADTVLFIHRDDYYNPESSTRRGEADIIIAKQRHGRLTTVVIRYDSNINLFTDETGHSRFGVRPILPPREKARDPTPLVEYVPAPTPKQCLEEVRQHMKEGTVNQLFDEISEKLGSEVEIEREWANERMNLYEAALAEYEERKIFGLEEEEASE